MGPSLANASPSRQLSISLHDKRSHGPSHLPLIRRGEDIITNLQHDIPLLGAPQDPWTFTGPKAQYTLSSYTQPSARVSWIATFLLTCMGDIVDFISSQGFRPDEPYPNGVYTCELRYLFPPGSIGQFSLHMEKVAAPGWDMTFADIADDLESIYYAALYFDTPSPNAGMPKLNFETHRYKNTEKLSGPTYLAAKGVLDFKLPVGMSVGGNGNGSLATS